MWSVFSASVVCILLLFLLAPETVGNKQIKFFQDSIGRRVRAAKTTNTGVRERIRKDTCTPYSDDYNRRIAVLECDAAYIEAVHKDEDTTCGNPIGAIISATDCGTYNGTVCSVFDNDYSLHTEFRNTLSSCFDLSDGIYRLPPQCRNECTLALRELSDRIGCCLYKIDYITILRTPSLWMNCGLERPRPCADSLEFPNQDIDIYSAPCSYRYYADRYSYTYCKNLGEELSKINMECGLSEQDTLQRCGYDKGKYCAYLNYQDQTLLPIYDKCISFFGTSNRNCNDECKSAIHDLKDTYGCCIITFNTTYTDNYDITASQVLRSDLWASCGIELPQNCLVSSLDRLRPPEGSPCGARGRTAVLIYGTLLIVINIGLVIRTH